jgi:hypothetical protein
MAEEVNFKRNPHSLFFAERKTTHPSTHPHSHSPYPPTRTLAGMFDTRISFFDAAIM